MTTRTLSHEASASGSPTIVRWEPSGVRPAGYPGNRRPAVFLDRDGTLIEHVHYLSDPARVRLLPGVGEALRQLECAGFARVVVTNQSGVGRGLITHECVGAIHTKLNRQLSAVGASLDAIYYCPIVPRQSDPTIIDHPDRKPGPGMLLRAACDLGLDLAASWMIGDLISDGLAGYHAGCRGSILVRTGTGHLCAESLGCPDLRICDDLRAAADLLIDDHIRIAP